MKNRFGVNASRMALIAIAVLVLLAFVTSVSAGVTGAYFLKASSTVICCVRFRFCLVRTGFSCGKKWPSLVLDFWMGLSAFGREGFMRCRSKWMK